MLPHPCPRLTFPFLNITAGLLALLASQVLAAPAVSQTSRGSGLTTGSWEPPVTGAEPPASGFIVDTTSRATVLDFYNRVYRSGLRADAVIRWTGNYSAGQAGATSLEFREHVRRRVNFYRAMAGLQADITFDNTVAKNDVPGPSIPFGTSKYTTTMAAAFMNSVSHALLPDFDLSHNPPDSYWYFSNLAWHGSRYSNLSAGRHGPVAIDTYMVDGDTNDVLLDNIDAGHRRWILYSRASDMSSGDVPPGYYTDEYGTEFCHGSNALYILGAVKPQAEACFTSWPNSGWCPATLVPARWSLSFPGADFSTASVTVTGTAGEISANIISHSATGIGDNTIVFTPSIPTGSMVNEDSWTVKVSGITGPGVPASYSWTTRGLNTESYGSPVALSGPATPPAVAARYSFTEVAEAESYVLTADTAAPASTFMLGAEDSQLADVIDLTSDSYALRETTHTAGTNNVPFSPRTGSRAFHLAFPDGDADQAFEIAPQFLLSATSRFEYYDCYRWLFTHNSMSVEITLDGGATWSRIGGRSGSYTEVVSGSYNTSLWDKNTNLSPKWIPQSIDLSQWAGRVARFRFILRAGENGFDGVDGRKGCYIDDIALTNAQRLAALTTITSTLPTFTIDGRSGLVAGSDYILQAAPVVGGYRMAWSAPLKIKPTTMTGVNAWIHGLYPNITGGVSGDHDRDSLANIVEYALGSDPTNAASGPGLIPSPVVVPGGNQGPATFQLTLPLSSSAAGIAVSGEYSCDLVNWQPVSNTGTAGTCTLCVPVDPRQKCGYYRIIVGTTP